MSDWKPIETAPKDGTDILVFVPCKGFEFHVAFFDKLWRGSTGEGCESHLPCQPTHWMELPNLPTQ